MIISITKLLILGSTTWKDLTDLNFDYPAGAIKTLILIILIDALLGLCCSLWILL